MTRTLYVFFISALLSTHLEGQVIARLVKAEGRVHFKRLGMSTFSEQGRPGAPIKNGDEIKVGEKSFAAVIYLDDRSILKVRENTKFSFMDTRNSRTVDLVHGTLLNDIKKEGRKKDFRIQTPVSVASVKGTCALCVARRNARPRSPPERSSPRLESRACVRARGTVRRARGQ